MSKSKAKSGLSAVRQFFERFFGRIPPNDYVVGAASFTSGIRDGQGHSSIHASVTNNTEGSLQILMAWRSTGPFVQIYQKTTTVDPATGFHTAEIVCPVVRRFVKVVFTPTAAPPGLGAGFELGSYFLPRADSPCFEMSGGSDPVLVSDVTVVDVTPGTTITTPANTALGIGATAALPVAPAGTRRVRVQVTGGNPTTEVLVREAAGAAGTGILLTRNGSTLYGGADGAIANLEAQNLAGPAVTVRVQQERD